MQENQPRTDHKEELSKYFQQKSHVSHKIDSGSSDVCVNGVTDSDVKTIPVLDSNEFSFSQEQNEVLYRYTENLLCSFWDSGVERLVHPKKGILHGVQDALDCSILPVCLKVKQFAGDECIDLTEAVMSGQVDRKSGKVIDMNTGYVTSFCEALEQGILWIETGDLTDPLSIIHSIQQEVGSGLYRLIASGEARISTQIVDRRTGRRFSFAEGITCSLLDPEDATVKDTVSGKRLSWDNAKRVGLISNSKPLTLKQAIVSYLSNSSSGTFFQPGGYGKVLTLQEMIDEGFVDPRKEEILNTNSDTWMTVSDAIDSDIIDPVQGKVFHQGVEKSLPFNDAVDAGIIDTKISHIHRKSISGLTNGVGDSFKETKSQHNPVNLITAIDSGLVDPVTSEVSNHGRWVSFSQACRRNMIEVDNCFVVDQSTALVYAFTEAADTELVDVARGTILDTLLAQKFSVFDAKQRGLLRSSNQPLLSLSVALQCGVLDPEEKCIRDPVTKHALSITKGIAQGIIDPSSKLTIPMSGQQVTLQEVISSGSLNIDSLDLVFPDGKKCCLVETLGFSRRRSSVLPRFNRKSSLTLDEAISRGIYDPLTNSVRSKDKGFVPLQEALEKDLIHTDSLVRDPFSGDILNLGEALEKRIIDPESGKMLDGSGQAIALNFAMDKGLILKSKAPLNLSLSETLDEGLFSAENNKFVNPDTSEEVDFATALSLGIIDPSLVKVRDTCTGILLNLEAAVNNGLINLEQGTCLDTEANEDLSIIDGLDKGIIVDTTNQPSVSLQEAIDEGILDVETCTFRDLASGFSVHLADAMESGLLDRLSVSVRDIRTNNMLTIDGAVSLGIVDPVTGSYTCHNTDEVLSFQQALDKGMIFSECFELDNTLTEAIKQGKYSENTGKFTDPSTGRVRDLKEVVNEDIFDIERLRVLDKGNQKLLTYKEAVDHKIIDARHALVVDSETSEMFSLREALDKGLLQENIDKLSLSLKQAVDTGLFSINDGKITDPLSKQHLSLETAIEIGVVNVSSVLIRSPDKETFEPLSDAVNNGSVCIRDTVIIFEPSGLTADVTTAFDNNILLDKPASGLPLADAFQIGLYNNDIQRFWNPVTGDYATLHEAICDKLIDADVPQVVVPEVGVFSLREAMDNGLIDPHTGKYIASELPLSLGDAVETGRLTLSAKLNISVTSVSESSNSRCSSMSSIHQSDASGSNGSKKEMDQNVHYNKPKSIQVSNNGQKNNIMDSEMKGSSESERTVCDCVQFQTESNKSETFKAESISKIHFQKDETNTSPRDKTVAVQGISKHDDLVSLGHNISAKIGKPKLQNENSDDSIQQNTLTKEMSLEKKDDMWASKVSAENTKSNEPCCLQFKELLDSYKITDSSLTEDKLYKRSISTPCTASDDLSSDLIGGPWSPTTKELSASLDSLIQNAVKNQQWVQKPLSLFEFIQNPAITDGKRCFQNPQTGSTYTLLEAINSNVLDLSGKVISPISKQPITLGEAVSSGIINPATGMYHDAATHKWLTLQQAKDVGYIYKEKETGKSPIEIYIEEILSDSSSSGKQKLEEAFSNGMLHRFNSQVIDLDNQPITLRRAASLGMIDVKSGEFKNQQTGECMSVSDAMERGFILHPKGLTLYSSVDQGLYSKKTGKFRDPVSKVEKSLKELIADDVISAICNEIRDMTQDSIVSLGEAIKRGIIDPVGGVYVNRGEAKRYNFIDAIAAGLIVSNSTREGLSDTSVMKQQNTLYPDSASSDPRAVPFRPVLPPKPTLPTKESKAKSPTSNTKDFTAENKNMSSPIEQELTTAQNSHEKMMYNLQDISKKPTQKGKSASDNAQDKIKQSVSVEPCLIVTQPDVDYQNKSETMPVKKNSDSTSQIPAFKLDVLTGNDKVVAEKVDKGIKSVRNEKAVSQPTDVGSEMSTPLAVNATYTDSSLNESGRASSIKLNNMSLVLNTENKSDKSVSTKQLDVSDNNENTSAVEKSQPDYVNELAEPKLFAAKIETDNSVTSDKNTSAVEKSQPDYVNELAEPKLFAAKIETDNSVTSDKNTSAVEKSQPDYVNELAEPKLFAAKIEKDNSVTSDKNTSAVEKSQPDYVNELAEPKLFAAKIEKDNSVTSDKNTSAVEKSQPDYVNELAEPKLFAAKIEKDNSVTSDKNTSAVEKSQPDYVNELAEPKLFAAKIEKDNSVTSDKNTSAVEKSQPDYVNELAEPKLFAAKIEKDNSVTSDKNTSAVEKSQPDYVNEIAEPKLFAAKIEKDNSVTSDKNTSAVEKSQPDYVNELAEPKLFAAKIEKDNSVTSDKNTSALEKSQPDYVNELAEPKLFAAKIEKDNSVTSDKNTSAVEKSQPDYVNELAEPKLFAAKIEKDNSVTSDKNTSAVEKSQPDYVNELAEPKLFAAKIEKDNSVTSDKNTSAVEKSQPDYVNELAEPKLFAAKIEKDNSVTSDKNTSAVEKSQPDYVNELAEPKLFAAKIEKDNSVTSDKNTSALEKSQPDYVNELAEPKLFAAKIEKDNSVTSDKNTSAVEKSQPDYVNELAEPNVFAAKLEKYNSDKTSKEQQSHPQKPGRIPANLISSNLGQTGLLPDHTVSSASAPVASKDITSQGDTNADSKVTSGRPSLPPKPNSLKSSSLGISAQDNGHTNKDVNTMNKDSYSQLDKEQKNVIHLTKDIKSKVSSIRDREKSEGSLDTIKLKWPNDTDSRKSIESENVDGTDVSSGHTDILIADHSTGVKECVEMWKRDDSIHSRKILETGKPDGKKATRDEKFDYIKDKEMTKTDSKVKPLIFTETLTPDESGICPNVRKIKEADDDDSSLKLNQAENLSNKVMTVKEPNHQFDSSSVKSTSHDSVTGYDEPNKNISENCQIYSTNKNNGSDPGKEFDVLIQNSLTAGDLKVGIDSNEKHKMKTHHLKTPVQRILENDNNVCDSVDTSSNKSSDTIINKQSIEPDNKLKEHTVQTVKDVANDDISSQSNVEDMGKHLSEQEMVSSFSRQRKINNRTVRFKGLEPEDISEETSKDKASEFHKDKISGSGKDKTLEFNADYLSNSESNKVPNFRKGRIPECCKDSEIRKDLFLFSRPNDLNLNRAIMDSFKMGLREESEITTPESEASRLTDILLKMNVKAGMTARERRKVLGMRLVQVVSLGARSPALPSGL